MLSHSMCFRQRPSWNVVALEQASGSRYLRASSGPLAAAELRVGVPNCRRPEVLPELGVPQVYCFVLRVTQTLMIWFFAVA